MGESGDVSVCMTASMGGFFCLPHMLNRCLCGAISELHSAVLYDLAGWIAAGTCKRALAVLL